MFSRSNGKDASMKAEHLPAPRREESGAPSIVSAGVRIRGDIESAGDVQLDGSVEGSVRCASLTVGEGGRIKGLIEAETVVVRGHVEGDIHANSLRLEKTSRLEGDMVHRSIAIEAGARISGRIVHAEDPMHGAAPVETDAVSGARKPAGLNGKSRPPGTAKAGAPDAVASA